MRFLFVILFFAAGYAKTYAQLDTHKVIRFLEVPKDKFLHADTLPLVIETYEELEKHLTLQGQMQKHVFDFKASYIEGGYKCPYCARCPDFKPCHRNACSYSFRWTVKNRAIKPVEYNRIFLDYLPLVLHREHKDTLIIYDKNVDSLVLDNEPEYIYLYQSLGGDCHVRYKHDIFIDENKKTLYWIVHNFYGGCRAGHYEDAYFRVKNPGAGYKVVLKESRE